MARALSAAPEEALKWCPLTRDEGVNRPIERKGDGGTSHPLVHSLFVQCATPLFFFFFLPETLFALFVLLPPLVVKLS